MNPRENNKLIAEFMGIPNRTEYGIFTGEAYTEVKGNDDEWIVARYHNSWDWLMPVVEKISLMPTVDDDFYYPRTFGMRDADGHFLFRFNRQPLYTASSLIEVTHCAVVEFIKWYNEQPK